MQSRTIFYQLFEQESSTYTYLIADRLTGEAALIDSVFETVERDIQLINELGLKLKYTLDTHIHADHITGAGELRKRLGTKSAVSEMATVDCVDIPLKDGQELMLGKLVVKALATPGHTNSCMSYLFEGRVFSGDSLMIRGTGRTDFQQGLAADLYDSVYNKLFTLPEETQVYPGHDYRGQTASTIGLEKKYNPRLRLGLSKDQFVQTMSELKLASPKKIHEAVAANLACGATKSSRIVSATLNDGLPEVSVESVYKAITKNSGRDTASIIFIDVREPAEFNNELGHIAGAVLITLGKELTNFLETGDRQKEIIFICRSGGRSGQATRESQRLGYKCTANMVGGMIRWNDAKYEVSKT